MELWIRSQDKNSLIKVYDMWIDDTDMVDQDYVSIMANSDFSFELGIYKTKERALEVLDEIQNHFKKIGTKEAIQHDKYGIELSFKEYTNIYEMPKK